MSVRILVAVGEALVRLGVLAVLRPHPDLVILGEAADGEEALTKAVTLRPDVVLIGAMLSDGDGIAAARRIKARCPAARVLMLVRHAAPDLLRTAAGAGVDECVRTDIAPAALLGVIRTAHRGGVADAPQAATDRRAQRPAIRHVHAPAPAHRVYGLTQREIDVLSAVAAGLSDKEIATRLLLSEATVRTHLRVVYRRLGCHNRTQAAAFAVESGLLTYYAGG